MPGRIPHPGRERRDLLERPAQRGLRANVHDENPTERRGEREGRPPRGSGPTSPPDPDPGSAASSAAPEGPGAGPRVTTYKGLELHPFQIAAIEAIQREENLLVCAPTGAGKTLVAEYAIEDAVKKGRRCLYTAPIKALSNQKYRDFRDDPNVDVGICTGDVTIRPEAQVLIMTTEILRNAIFDDPAILHDVEYAIFDEVHFLDDPERGTVWEESLIFAPPSMRFVCLSATISNDEELGAWLEEIREQPIRVLKSTKRPVPLHHKLYTEASGSFDLKKLERIRKREARTTPPKSRRRERGGGRRRGFGRRGEFGPPDPAPLFDELEAQGLLPALCFAFSRRECEASARRNAARSLLTADEARRMQDLQEELCGLFQLDRLELSDELFGMARRGVCYHHAGMLPIHKELVERMFTSGLLKLLFTTETFALGINMPARTVVFLSLKKFDGVTVDYLRTRDFLQMAGRAGRQGLDEEGLVFALLGPRDLFAAPLHRLVHGRPEPVTSRFRLAFSTLLHLCERLGRQRIVEAWEKSFNQFQHRSGSKKQRQKNRRENERVIAAHLDFLESLGYLAGDTPTARGRMARCINGYELQVTELAYRGVLEDLTPEALCVVFVAIVHEDRRRGPPLRVSVGPYGSLRHRVDTVLGDLAVGASELGLSPPKAADWTLTPIVIAWLRGETFAEIDERTDLPPGDVVRTLRLALQLMRQVRHAIDPAWDLGARLDEARRLVNRDEVDARRQLELG